MNDEVNKQLLLEGFEHPCNQDAHNLKFSRRRSDRSVHRTRWLDRSETGERSLIQTDTTPAVSVFTLGRFSLLLDGEPAEFGRKMPHRPLELLKTIIAQGGRNASISGLTSVLWPDTDGDTAQRSFDTTLHRLRKLLGDDRVLVLRDGKLSLDTRYCWIDIWAFERLLGRVQRILREDAAGKQSYSLERMMDNLFSLYQDHFLAREDMTSWSVSTRERLRSKFINTLLQAGQYWETHGNWNQASQCYQKGIDVDDLVEVFYQRLMHCCLQTSRISEGMTVYRRCRQVLSIVLGLQPEAATEALYQSLCNSRLNSRSA